MRNITILCTYMQWRQSYFISLIFWMTPFWDHMTSHGYTPWRWVYQDHIYTLKTWGTHSIQLSTILFSQGKQTKQYNKHNQGCPILFPEIYLLAKFSSKADLTHLNTTGWSPGTYLGTPGLNKQHNRSWVIRNVPSESMDQHMCKIKQNKFKMFKQVPWDFVKTNPLNKASVSASLKYIYFRHHNP